MDELHYAGLTAKQLQEKYELYTRLRFPPRNWRDSALGWWAFGGGILGVGALLNAFVDGVDWVSGTVIALVAPGVWLQIEKDRRLQWYSKQIDTIRAELDRRGH